MAAETIEIGDKTGALHVLKKLAGEGVKAAYIEIGKIYEIGGGGVEPNFAEALRWYRRSAYEADRVEGYLALARMYYQGKGVEVDYSEAFRLYSLAVRNDKPIAHLMLARLYCAGRGVRQNLEFARNHYRRAIELGNVNAIRELGYVEYQCGRELKALLLGLRGTFLRLWVRWRNPQDPRLREI